MDVWALLCRSSPGTHRAVCCSCSPGRWGREIVALKEGSYSRASLPSHGVINFLLLFIFVAPPPHLSPILLKVWWRQRSKSPPLISSVSCRLNFLPPFVGRIFQMVLLLSRSPFVVLSGCSD